jgi:hypothetical protein
MHVKLCNAHIIARACNETCNVVTAFFLLYHVMHVIFLFYELHVYYMLTRCYMHLVVFRHPLQAFIVHLQAFTALFHAVNMPNTHEDLRSRQSTWMVAGFVPHIDAALSISDQQKASSC